MKSYRLARILKFVLMGLIALGLFGLVVMSLWNWLMPAIFGMPAITFWQALGVLVLSRILFGGMSSSGRRSYWRHRMAKRWSQMTPEEREKFVEGMKRRCGGFEPQAPDPTV